MQSRAAQQSYLQRAQQEQQQHAFAAAATAAAPGGAPAPAPAGTLSMHGTGLSAAEEDAQQLLVLLEMDPTLLMQPPPIIEVGGRIYIHPVVVGSFVCLLPPVAWPRTRPTYKLICFAPPTHRRTHNHSAARSRPSTSPPPLPRRPLRSPTKGSSARSTSCPKCPPVCVCVCGRGGRGGGD